MQHLVDATRFDVVPIPGGFLLTDGRSPPQPFITSSAAVNAARAKAESQQGAVEIYLWRNGVEERVYARSAG